MPKITECLLCIRQILINKKVKLKKKKLRNKNIQQ